MNGNIGAYVLVRLGLLVLIIVTLTAGTCWLLSGDAEAAEFDAVASCKTDGGIYPAWESKGSFDEFKKLDSACAAVYAAHIRLAVAVDEAKRSAETLNQLQATGASASTIDPDCLQATKSPQSCESLGEVKSAGMAGTEAVGD